MKNAEHFEMQVFNATPLYVLDICEVCGSYQCPYCPYFSASPKSISLDLWIYVYFVFTCIFKFYFY